MSRAVTLLAQDAVGAVPANQPGQPVGLIRRRAGTVDAAQATSAARPTLVRWPMTGRRNFLTWTEVLSNPAITKSNVTIALEAGVWRITPNTANATHGLGWGISAASNGTYTVSIDVKTGSYRWARLCLSVSGQLNAWFDLDNCVPGSSSAEAGTTYVGHSITDLGGSWRRIRLSGVPGTTLSNTFAALFRLCQANGEISGWAGDGIGSNFVRRPQLEAGAAATAYQVVADTTDVTEAGVPDSWRLSMDGVDDRLLTPTLAMASDEVTLVMAAALPATGTQYGVLRMADAGGTIGVVKASDNQLRFHAGASSVPVVAPATPASGAPEVWTMQAKISASQITIRRNGGQVATSAASQGTGLYPTGALEIGSWAGGQWGPLRLYGLMMINRMLTPHELTLTERWAGSLCGVPI